MDYDVSSASPLALDPIKVPKKRGRPKKDLGLSLERASSSSAGNSAPPTPAALAMEDPLLAAELDAFGVPGTEETLPLPPREGASGSGAGGAGGPKRSIEAALPAAPLGRAKRPKNVKFSPAKSGKALARRSMTTGGGGSSKASGYTDGDQLLPNNDYCDACNGKGHFLCCEGGCLRSFHFTCLEPPLELEDVPDESWYCKACRAAQESPPMPRRNFFEDLIHKIDCENPKAFVLPAEIKGFFKNVATGPAGDFIDSKEHRPPSKITGRAIGQEDRDGYRLKDKVGRTILCYKCGSSASLPQQRKIISCDFCDQHWHLDCLNPPMTGMPPPTRKWMCPVHSDHVLPKKRQPKQTTTISVHDQHARNNGDIVIVPLREPREVTRDDFEDVTVNRVRYQVPEETVILDFWGRVHEAPKMRGLRSPQRKQLFQDLAAAQANGSRETSPYSMGSPLTSLGDLSDADPPEVATLGYSPYSKNRMLRAVPTIPQQLDTSALDDLALLAEGYYLNLVEEQQQVKVAPPAPSPTPISASSSAPPPASAALASGDVPMPDAAPLPTGNGYQYEPFVATEEQPAPARATANGLVIKLPARNGGTRPPVVPATSDARPPLSFFADSGSEASRDKGKGRASDAGPPRTNVVDSGPLIFPARPKTIRKSLATPGLILPAKLKPFIDPLASSSAPSRSSTPQVKPAHVPSMNPTSMVPSIPPFRGAASVVSPRSRAPSVYKLPHNNFREGAKPPKLASTQPDLEVHSKDDLQALMRVRRLMSGEGAVDEATKAAMLGFIDGGAVVPKLVFIKPEKELQPWDLPWEEEAAAKAAPASHV